MSFSSDVSFPEPESFNGSDDHDAHDDHAALKNARFSRDAHNLWTAILEFRQQYGEANLQRVIDMAKR